MASEFNPHPVRSHADLLRYVGFLGHTYVVVNAASTGVSLETCDPRSAFDEARLTGGTAYRQVKRGKWKKVSP